jgi:hypothetical protein
MAVFISTFPEVLCHVKMIDKGFGTGKGQYGIVRKVGSATEHLHLVIVFYTVHLSLIRTPSYVTNCFTDQVILHKLVVMLYYCKDIELFRKFQVNGEVFCEVTPSQGLWRSNNHLTTEETEVNGKCGNSYHIYTATL